MFGLSRKVDLNSSALAHNVTPQASPLGYNDKSWLTGDQLNLTQMPDDNQLPGLMALCNLSVPPG